MKKSIDKEQGNLLRGQLGDPHFDNTVAVNGVFVINMSEYVGRVEHNETVAISDVPDNSSQGSRKVHD